VITVRSFLVRGLLAGLIAGILAFGVAYAVGEPAIDAAIAIEESGGHSHAEEPAAGTEKEAAGTEVSRSVQATAGLLTATAVAGTTLGGVVGVLSALALGRFGSLGVRGTTLLVAGLGFVSLYVLPFVAYPPNPPAVGSADTIGTRTVLYLATVAVSVIAAVAAVLVGRRLATRVGAWWAALAAVAGYLLVGLGAVSLLPAYDEVPADFPATVLYSFRTGSFVTALALWAVLAVVLAELAHRVVRAADPAKADPQLATMPS
jgi:Probable cobalt transporter subunit (CbtA)